MSSILNSRLTRLLRLAFLLFAFGNSAAYAGAGNRVGNGGNVILCAGKAPRLLDLWELDGKLFPKTADVVSKAPSPIPSAAPAVESGHGAAISEAGRLLARLKGVDAKTYAILERSRAQFADRTEWRSGILVTDVRDSFESALPKDCELRQIALRRNSPLPSEKRFDIDADAWLSLDAEGRAALILHEIIYDYFAGLGETDSRKARKWVGFFVSDNPTFRESDRYRNWVREARLPIYP